MWLRSNAVFIKTTNSTNLDDFERPKPHDLLLIEHETYQLMVKSFWASYSYTLQCRWYRCFSIVPSESKESYFSHDNTQLRVYSRRASALMLASTLTLKELDRTDWFQLQHSHRETLSSVNISIKNQMGSGPIQKYQR